jgi:hypothetical protein
MRFAIVFAVVYAIAYLVCVERNYALFTYHPAIGEWGVGVEKGRDGPAMYWYGWMASSTLAASLAGAAAMLLPQSAARRLPAGASWVAAAAAMLAFCYLLRGFFLR